MDDTADALTSYLFEVNINGIEMAHFREVTGLSMEVKVIENECLAPGGKRIITKEPGPRTWGDVTLKRGQTKSMEWWKWIGSIHPDNLSPSRRDVTIKLYNFAGEQMLKFDLLNCWPSKVSMGGLQAGGSEILVEECSLVHEGITLDDNSQLFSS